MPIVQVNPGGGSGPNGEFTLCDLVPDVVDRLENRATDTTKILGYLRDAVIEISTNGGYRDDFVELEVLGPQFVLTPGTQSYDQSNIMPPGDVNVATLDIRLWQDPPSNSFWRKLDPSNYQRVDEATIGPTQPTKWVRFGNNIEFDCPPDKPYQIQARALRFHPIIDGNLCNTIILLPRDWNEVLVWAAAERGFMALEEYEKAGAIHTYLYGDPQNPQNPGITAGRIKKRANENWRQQKALRPTVRRISYGGR